MAFPFALLVSAVAGATASEERRARLHELCNRLGFAPTHTQRDYRTAVLEAVATIPNPVEREAAWIAFFLMEPAWRHAVRMGPDPEDPSRWPPEGLHSEWIPLLPWIARVMIPQMQAELGTGPNLLGRFVAERAVPLRDWWRATSPDLGRMTFHEAEGASIAWHETFKVAAFQKPAPPGVPLMRWPDGGTVERLLTRTQVDGEGMAMGHCVGSHWKDVASGKTAILSYRGPDGVPGATVEIDLDPAHEDDIELKDVEGPHNDFATQPAGMRMETFLEALRDGIPGTTMEGDLHRLGWAGVPALPHELKALEKLRIPIFPKIAKMARELRAAHDLRMDTGLDDEVRDEAGERFDALADRLESAQHAILDGVALLRDAIVPILKRWGWSWGFSFAEHDNALVSEGIFDDDQNPAVDLAWELDREDGNAGWWLSASDDDGISQYLGGGEDPLKLLRKWTILHEVERLPDREEGIPGAWLVPPADVLLDPKAFQAVHGSGPAVRLKRRRDPRP
jgi:hypothetical protein